MHARGDAVFNLTEVKTLPCPVIIFARKTTVWSIQRGAIQYTQQSRTKAEIS